MISYSDITTLGCVWVCSSGLAAADNENRSRNSIVHCIVTTHLIIQTQRRGRVRGDMRAFIYLMQMCCCCTLCVCLCVHNITMLNWCLPSRSWLQDVADSSLQCHRWSSSPVCSVQMGDPCCCAVSWRIGADLARCDCGAAAGHCDRVHTSSGVHSIYIIQPYHIGH